MYLDFNAITAIATVIAVFIAMLAIWTENKRSRYSQGIELLFQMCDRFFYSKHFVENRRKAITFLKKNFSPQRKNKAGQLAKSEHPSSLELDAILDFFQGIALLVREGIIDKKLTWNFLIYWLDNYYTLSKEYLEYWRKYSPDAWDDVDWLHEQLVKIENKKLPNGYT